MFVRGTDPGQHVTSAPNVLNQGADWQAQFFAERADNWPQQTTRILLICRLVAVSRGQQLKVRDDSVGLAGEMFQQEYLFSGQVNFDII